MTNEEIVAKAKTMKQLTQNNETKILCDLIVALSQQHKEPAGFAGAQSDD